MKKKTLWGFLFTCSLLAFLTVESSQNAHAEMMDGHMKGRKMMGNKLNQTVQVFDPTDIKVFTNRLKLPGSSGLLGILNADSQIQLSASEQKTGILPGLKTSLLVYQANYNGKTFINPIIKIKKGDEFSLKFLNNLNEESIIHWHGIKTASKDDGMPQSVVNKGETYQYNFQVNNDAGTYWYHPHPHGQTGKQAYLGLASFYIVDDLQSESLEKSLGLEIGKTDIPLVIQDKRFDKTGKLVYKLNQMNRFMGYYGDTILVNLTPAPYLETEARIYRLRLLNGSNARIYRLAFTKNTDSFPFFIIAGDAGFLDKPYPASEVFLSPGERVEILLDLTKEKSGSELFLKSLEFDPMENEMGGKMKGMMDKDPDLNLQNGQEFYVLKFTVTGSSASTGRIPEKLSVLPGTAEKDVKIRKITISQKDMQWFMNGKQYNMDEYPIEVNKGTREIWEIVNPDLSMPHPMHIHGFQFLVLQRKGSPNQAIKSVIDSQGRLVTDLGYKDTVLVWPGETVRVLIDFTHNYQGTQDYVFHCHILEHEDGGMMLNYRVLE